jgi:transposase
MKKTNKVYTEEFKQQIAKLHASGKTSSELEKEYGVSRTTINICVKQYANSGKFGTTANLSDAEKENRELRKENKHLRMENDILKQAAVIFARREP